MAVLSVKSLPLGFRFRPTDEELINHYLRLKINGRDSEVKVIPEVDVCKWEPWDLPGLSVIKTDDPDWFFFPHDRKYPNGHRSNRATNAGYWKATGTDRTMKSRKSSSNIKMIGMKKTLVFYRGRAPKGERTHWIMHEYRPTEKDLDGTGPGQCAFLLFRLFRKPELKPEADKYDETEPTGSSPTATKSSPDDTSSDAVQEIAMFGMNNEKQSEGMSRWLIDKLDNKTSNDVLPVDSCSDSYMAFDGEDHVAEETVREASPLDCKVFSPLQSHIQTDFTQYVDSPFAYDFGYDHNGLHFQEGTSDQDVSLTELLDGVFNNQDEFSCEESMFQKNSVADSEIHLSGLTSMFQVTPLGKSYCEDSGSYSGIDTGMSQEQCNPDMGASGWFNEDRMDLAHMQNSVGSLGTQMSSGDIELQCDFGTLGENYVGHGVSADTAMGTFYNMEDSSRLKSHVNYGGDSVGGTGIKIRSRPTRQLPSQLSSGSIINQGTAPRRIRLQVNDSASSVCNDKVGDAVCNDKVEDAVYNDDVGDAVCSQEDKGHSTVNKVEEDTKHTPVIDELEKVSQLLKFNKSMDDISEDFSSKLRVRGKQDGELDCNERGLSSSPEKYHVFHGINSLLIYTVSASLILFLLVFGFWKGLDVA